MSAIGAIFSPDGVREAQLDRMRETLGQVPHDDAGTWLGGKVGLVGCTLHTNAQSREQAQPHTNEDGRIAVVFDGYLLNPDELIANLSSKGAAFRNQSDVEIALRAYEVWGEACADQLEGEFALIVADTRAGRLFAARDHMGFAPLYYREENGSLILASDFRTLLALSETTARPNHAFLAQIMTNTWYLRDDTPWREIKRLVRAHTLSFDGSKLTLEKYWTPPTEITIRYKTDEEYADHYRELLFDCVKRASRSDRQVGVAVSGGLDSSALFLVGHQLEGQGEWLAPSMAGYSLAASEDGNAFELPYARAAAAHAGRELNEVPLFDPDIDWYTNDGRWHRDLPIPSNGAMMLDMERRVVEDGGCVIINGVGGDEWLTGNNLDYREYLKQGNAGGFWQALKHDRAAFGSISALKTSLRQVAGELTPEPLRRSIRARFREKRRAQDVALKWIAPELRTALADAEEAYEASMPHDAVDWAKTNLASSPFSDLSHSMMRRQRAVIGVESRHPMLSRAFIEFSLKTPTNIKRRGSVSKLVHRNALAGILPDIILNRTTKANFTNAKIDTQFAAYARKHAAEWLAEICDLEGLSPVLSIDFGSPEGDYWAWEIWGLYASAAFLYQCGRKEQINPATGVQPDRTSK